jgi:glutamate-ammonia-ligase adenylyltransferase
LLRTSCARNKGTEFEKANKIARRFVALLDAPMKEGRAYPTDTRLRPSGRSGPPTVSLSSFETYQAKQAHTWEHLALVTSRVVLDDPGIGQDIRAVRRAILSKPRDGLQLCQDAWKMLGRLRRARYEAAPSDGEVKLRPGGLMELEFLINVQVLTLAADHPELLDQAPCDLPTALDRQLGSSSCLADDALALQHAQFLARLYGSDWRAQRPFDGLEALFERVAALVQSQIAEPSGLNEAQLVGYQETAVHWQSAAE